MGKLDKEQEARMAGMSYALGIAEKKRNRWFKKRIENERSFRSWIANR